MEVSRKKTRNTVIAWPQCAQTKVGDVAANASSADSLGGGGVTFNNSRAIARLSRLLLLASKP